MVRFLQLKLAKAQMKEPVSTSVWANRTGGRWLVLVQISKSKKAMKISNDQEKNNWGMENNWWQIFATFIRIPGQTINRHPHTEFSVRNTQHTFKPLGKGYLSNSNARSFSQQCGDFYIQHPFLHSSVADIEMRIVVLFSRRLQSSFLITNC